MQEGQARWRRGKVRALQGCAATVGQRLMLQSRLYCYAIAAAPTAAKPPLPPAHAPVAAATTAPPQWGRTW